VGYQTQSIDTNYDVEQAQIQLLRKFGTVRRFALLANLSNSTRRMSWLGLSRSRQNLTSTEKKRLFIEAVYGKKFLEAVKFRTIESFMAESDIVAAVTRVVETFERLKIPYLIGGSVASSVLGIPRSTQDVDLVADFEETVISELLAGLEQDFYLSEIAVREALKLRSSFNLLHNDTGIKVDVFLVKEQAFSRTSFARRQETLVENSPRTFSMYTPEDIVIQKMLWYIASNNSEKQWLDILGVLKIQENLDIAYLQEWANHLNLGEHLSRALDEAGLTS
jgi:hypothetical protein